jgi:GNAT superfamily N-acetyltransferase
VGAVTIRLGTTADLDVICAQRRAMFEEMGIVPRVPHDESIAAFGAWASPRMDRGEYVAFLACDADQVIAGAGLWLMDWPPTPQSVATRRGYVLNVYTRPDARGLGLARQLMDAVTRHCLALAIDIVTLHASDAGRHLYETLDFVPTNEMRTVLDPS